MAFADNLQKVGAIILNDEGNGAVPSTVYGLRMRLYVGELNDYVNGNLPQLDAITTNRQSLYVMSSRYCFNGATWDRVRGNHSVVLLASAARTAETASADQTLYNSRGIRVIINVSAVTDTPGLTVNIQVKDSISAAYSTVLASAAITATGTTTLVVYPGCIAVANLVANLPMARTWRVLVAVADADSATYSVSVDNLE